MEERLVFEVQNEVGIDPVVLINLEPEALKPMSMKWLRTKIVMATYASSPVKVWPLFRPESSLSAPLCSERHPTHRDV